MTKIVSFIIPIISTCIFMSCNTHGDWDYYKEFGPSFNLSDVGTILRSPGEVNFPNDTIAEAAFEVYVKHDKPNTLLITFFYNNDSFPIWTDDFPGGRVEFRIDSLVGLPVNANYVIKVKDPIEDGYAGKFVSFTIKLNFY